MPVTSLPTLYGNPQSIAVDAQGSLYYADLALEGTIFTPETGSDGKVWRVAFDANGDPLPPEIVVSELGFPDGVAILPGNIEATEWRTLGGSVERKYFNPKEFTINAANAGQLVKRWEFPTTAIVTDSPSVASIALPGEGRQSIAFFADWNGVVYAVRLEDGSELWSFQAAEQPGSNYPGAGSAHVETVGGEDRVFIAYGETMYALDAVTGSELWHFTAGTGCRDAQGNPPGSCGFQGERNEIESTAAIADGTVFFAMDTNDSALGKGGFYGVDVNSGHLRWFFDFASLSTCRPDPGDAVTHFDGYHSADELGLPAGLLRDAGGLRLRSHAERLRQRVVVRGDRCGTRSALLGDEQLRRGRRSLHAETAAADAALRRGDLRAALRRNARVALAPARSRSRGLRLRRRAESVHDHDAVASRATSSAWAARTAPIT